MTVLSSYFLPNIKGQKLLLADAKPDGLVGYWSFDDYKVKMMNAY